MNLVEVTKALRVEGFDVCYEGVRRFWCRYLVRGNAMDAKKPGRPDRAAKEHPDIKNVIHRKLLENNEKTAKKLLIDIEEECGVKLTATKVKKYRRELGWKYCNVKYGQLVR